MSVSSYHVLSLVYAWASAKVVRVVSFGTHFQNYAAPTERTVVGVQVSAAGLAVTASPVVGGRLIHA